MLQILLKHYEIYYVSTEQQVCVHKISYSMRNSACDEYAYTVKKAVELLDAPLRNTFLKSNKNNSNV